MPESASPVGELRAECEGFTRYLVGASPTEYVIAKYLRGHGAIPYLAVGPEPTIDRVLVGLARRGRIPARISDAYARCFRPSGSLRQKLALLLAILENSPPYHLHLNSAATFGRGRIAANVLLSGLGFGLCLLSGILFLAPFHLLLRLGAARAPADSFGRG